MPPSPARTRRWIPAAAVLMLAACAATAGPFRDFERELRDAYGDYRVALFATNGSDSAAAAKALATFEGKWNALLARWGAAPPPQYADDPSWLQVTGRVRAIVDDAKRSVTAGKLPAAHESLEHVRDELGALNRRNNIATFSDRMNAYHEKMERALGGTLDLASPPGRESLGGEIAVLTYLAGELAEGPPEAKSAAAEYDKLLGAVRSSLDGVRGALALGDPSAIRDALKAVKPAYARLFLRFG